MPLPKNPAAYIDVREELDKIIALGKSVKIQFPTRKQANRWRLEAYAYRRLLQELEGGSPYDRLQFIIDTASPETVLVMNRFRPSNIQVMDEELTPAMPAPDKKVGITHTNLLEAEIDKKVREMARTMGPDYVWQGLEKAYGKEKLAASFDRIGLIPPGQGDLIE